MTEFVAVPTPRAAETRYFGVDFSGAVDAGRKIWVSEVVHDSRQQRLKVVSCTRAEFLPNSGRERGQCLAALRAYISKQSHAIVGMDFPFGIHRSLLKGAAWSSWISTFRTHYSDPATFRATCWEAAGRCEIKRQTEREAKTPFNPYNLRLYRQTYFGIAEVIAPLVTGTLARVVPQQRAKSGIPSLVEVCAACTLKHLSLYPPYKGRGDMAREARLMIVRNLRHCGIAPLSTVLRAEVIADTEGDALDSIIAASAAYRAANGEVSIDSSWGSPYRVEGNVFL